jgi:hypothetical protein
MVHSRCPLPTSAVVLFSVAIGIAVTASAQDKEKGSVRVEHVSLSSPVLHLNTANGPTCGTATVRVTVQGLGQFPNPTLVVSLAGYSTVPPGVTIDVANLSPATGRVPSQLTQRSSRFGSALQAVQLAR